MKKILVLLFVFLLGMPVFSEIITGGVECSVEDARSDVFSSPPIGPIFEYLRANLVDSNYGENISTLLSGNAELKDRTLAKFSDGSYGVIYKDNPKSVLYYSHDGILTHNEIKESLDFPYKTYKYTPQGQLVNMTLRVSEDETFIFTPDKKLLAHWLGAICYDEDKNIIMRRQIVK